MNGTDRIGKTAIMGTSAIELEPHTEAELVYLDFTSARRPHRQNVFARMVATFRSGTCVGVESRSIDLSSKMVIASVMVGFLFVVIGEGLLMML